LNSKGTKRYYFFYFFDLFDFAVRLEDHGMKKILGSVCLALVLMIALSVCAMENGDADITYSVHADGAADTASSAALAFTFSGPVGNLTAEDITLSGDAGAAVTKGSLAGEGQNRSLEITVNAAGNLKVQITRAGIENTEKTVTVYKAGSGNSEGNGNSGESNGSDSGGNDENDGVGESSGGDENNSNDNDDNGDGDDDGNNTEPEPYPAIEFASEDYSSGLAFDDSAWTGQGTATESWTLTVMEQSTVYFAVYKPADKTITVGGTGAGKVTQAAKDAPPVDGLAARDDLAVFTVQTGDLVFDGGERVFTLSVDDPEALPGAVNITLKVSANKTGAALFTLAEKDGDGVESLERVGGSFNGLVEAFTWFENNAAANTEYTLRVEKSESNVPILVMGANNVENATLRFRGTKDGPKTLIPVHLEGAYDGTETAKVNVQGLSATSGFINIGCLSDNRFTPLTHPKRTFILGSNITIQSHQMNAANAQNYKSVFEVGRNATLVLEPGSVITGHKIGNSCVLISIQGSNNPAVQTANGCLRIEGGSIIDCQVAQDRALIRFTGAMSRIWNGSFYLAPGALALTNSTPAQVGFQNPDTHNYFDLDPAKGMSVPPAP
jgi:hypothetical protein